MKTLEKYFKKNGKPFIPEDLPDDIQMGRVGDCYDTSAIIATRRKYRYVEGLARNPLTGEWILHAWVTDGLYAYDPTWFTVCDGKHLKVKTDYIGIEMDIETVALFMGKTGYKAIVANHWRNREISKKMLPKGLPEDDIKNYL